MLYPIKNARSDKPRSQTRFTRHPSAVNRIEGAIRHQMLLQRTRSMANGRRSAEDKLYLNGQDSTPCGHGIILANQWSCLDMRIKRSSSLQNPLHLVSCGAFVHDSGYQQAALAMFVVQTRPRTKQHAVPRVPNAVDRKTSTCLYSKLEHHLARKNT